MGDAHEMIVYHVGKIIGRLAIRLDHYGVVQLGAVHFNMPVQNVVKTGNPRFRNVLPDDLRLAFRDSALGFRQRNG
jgi:hypothetical protein